jgi:SAM-dependent methyltransferase
MTERRRLNLGCGPRPVAGWVNADREPFHGIDVHGDLRTGLPIDSGRFEWVVAIHVLQDLAWPDIPGALAEVKRILKPGGVLRLALPDLDRAIDAYRRGDADYFFIPDEDARAVGAKLVTQIIWYGSVRTPFTLDFACECLADAGFREIGACAFGQTRHGEAGIAELDNRERESFFVEALK